ncbi:hypothetical protein Leryth_025480 [Lithospermum erythrorhizon]|nr:hypothetical protein Leryth_025480 [Lithospermum erythrorhizon]
MEEKNQTNHLKTTQYNISPKTGEEAINRLVVSFRATSTLVPGAIYSAVGYLDLYLSGYMAQGMDGVAIALLESMEHCPVKSLNISPDLKGCIGNIALVVLQNYKDVKASAIRDKYIDQDPETRSFIMSQDDFGMRQNMLCVSSVYRASMLVSSSSASCSELIRSLVVPDLFLELASTGHGRHKVQATTIFHLCAEAALTGGLTCLVVGVIHKLLRVGVASCHPQEADDFGNNLVLSIHAQRHYFDI